MGEWAVCGGSVNDHNQLGGRRGRTYQNLKGTLPFQLAILTSKIVPNRKIRRRTWEHTRIRTFLQGFLWRWPTRDHLNSTTLTLVYMYLTVWALYDPQIPFLGMYPEKTIIQNDIHTKVHCSTVYNSQYMNGNSFSFHDLDVKTVD